MVVFVFFYVVEFCRELMVILLICERVWMVKIYNCFVVGFNVIFNGGVLEKKYRKVEWFFEKGIVFSVFVIEVYWMMIDFEKNRNECELKVIDLFLII